MGVKAIVAWAHAGGVSGSLGGMGTLQQTLAGEMEIQVRRILNFSVQNF